jgi:hypothetical protein
MLPHLQGSSSVWGAGQQRAALVALRLILNPVVLSCIQDAGHLGWEGQGSN